MCASRLNLKGLAAHENIVDIDKNEQRSEDFLAINPLGAIPALVDHDHERDAAGNERAPLTQSTAILEYLEEVQPSPPLLPADPYGRARVRSLSLMLAADTHPLITPRVRRSTSPPRGSSTTQPGAPGRPAGSPPACRPSSASCSAIARPVPSPTATP